MIPEKMLTRIHAQINELAPCLELFLEESIQPSSAECEKLQQLLHELQCNLSIYIYHKKEKELSPSFNIHAKISEVEPEPLVTASNIEEPVKVEVNTNETQIEETPEPVSENKKVLAPLVLAINDKFRIINELFKQNATEYNIAIEQLNTLNAWEEAEVYLNSLKAIYQWKDNSETVKQLYLLVKKRYL